MKVDRELLKQLKEAEARKMPMEVVLMLRDDLQKAALPKPQLAEQAVNKALRRVERKVKGHAHKFTTFARLGSLAVSADGPFIRELLRQPEFESAIANHQPDEMFIKPVRRRVI